MKFDLTGSVTGADLCPGVVMLTLPPERLGEILEELGAMQWRVDAFVSGRQQATAAVLPPEEETEEAEARLLPLGAAAEGGFFRLMLRGRSLSGGRGLAGAWEAALAGEGIRPRLSCIDEWGVVQYFPAEARPAVLDLLHRAFGIRSL